MGASYRSRRQELAALRVQLSTKGAPTHQIALMIATRFKVNSRVAHRYAAGLTQQQVADAWNQLWEDGTRIITHKHVSYWEAWPAATGRAPSPDDLNKLARIYRCRAADLLDGEDHTAEAPSTPARSTYDAQPSYTVHAEPSDVLSRVDRFIAESDFLAIRESHYQQFVKVLIEWAVKMHRRDILHWLSWAAAAAAAAPVLDGLDEGESERTVRALSAPHRVDDTVLDHVEAVLWRCMRQDDTLGPQAALDTVLAQRQLVRSLLPDAPATVRARALSLYANLSRFAGWLAFDLNNYDAANEYYETARAAAHEAHNTELGAFVLCNMSHLASWRGQPRIGIDHAVAAQGWAAQTDDWRLQAYAYDVAARAHAIDGQARAALQAVERARAALSRADQPSAWVYFLDAGLLTSTESTCYLYLGQADRAVATAEQALAEMDGSFVRNRALATLDLGVARLRGARPDVGGGASAIAEASHLAVLNRSARLGQRLRDGAHQLEPWRDAPEVKDARDQLMAYGYS